MDPRLPFVAESSASLSFVTAAPETVPVQFDSTKFVNTFRVPIEIRHLSFSLEARLTSGLAGQVEIDPAMIVQVSAKLGRSDMTDNFVPISVIAPYKSAAGGGSIFVESYTVANGYTAFTALRRLVFSKPIILKPGMAFNFRARIPSNSLWSTIGSNATIITRIAMVGRYLTAADKIPATNRVPMISHVELSQNKRMSLEQDLRNPLEVPIDVERIVATVNPNINNNVVDYPENGFSGLSRLTLRYPNADPVSDDPLYVAREFANQLHVAPLRFQMPKASRLQATLEAYGGASVQEIGAYYQIALHGVREEAL